MNVIPSVLGRKAVLLACLVWAATALVDLGSVWFGVGFAVAAVGYSIWSQRCLIGLAVSAGVLAGLLGLQEATALLTAPLPTGEVEIAAVVLTDPVGSRYLVRPEAIGNDGRWVSWRGPPLLAISYRLNSLDLGDTVELRGSIAPEDGLLLGTPYRGRIEASPQVVNPSKAPWYQLGNRLRRSVTERLKPWKDDPAAGLLKGFLVGDTSSVPEADQRALRRTGLGHFVAVSGSNVALFLAMWWAVLAPIAVNPRLRALSGLLGLAAFVVATRAEPSVVRAGVMAGLVLLARLFGYPLDAWTAFGAALTGILLLAPVLGSSTGFQLSAAATAGVMIGARAGKGWRSQLGAAVGAQTAVLPILLWKFGSVPLFGSLLNLMVAPVVVAASLAGGVGIGLRLEPLTSVAVALARTVLQVARFGEPLPQVGAWTLPVVLVAGLAASRRRLRPAVAVAAGATVLVLALSPPVGVTRPAAVFLDVGQGDATLLLGAEVAILIDGGRDPGLLMDRLTRYGVRHLDLMVATHPDEDHMAGLVLAVERLAVDKVWDSSAPHESESLPLFLAAANRRHVSVDTPPVGHHVQMGEFDIEVLGPVRRYGSSNDQSIVLAVKVRSESLLLTGDVEVIGQADLPARPYDVVKIPHHGGGTSDASWLRAVVDDVAVVSVGQNTYGHPVAWVMELLEQEAETVRRTDEEGDVVISFA